MDLYQIIKTYKFSLPELIKKAKIKFDTHIDPLKLGSQFILAEKLKDYPRLVGPLNHTLWRRYFMGEAKKLGKTILK